MMNSRFPIQNHFIDVYVFIDHALDGEMPFNMAATVCAVNLFNTCNASMASSTLLTKKPFLPFSISSGMLPRQRRSRASAGHGFDNGQTERLIKLYGVQQRQRPCRAAGCAQRVRHCRHKSPCRCLCEGRHIGHNRPGPEQYPPISVFCCRPWRFQ
jgi:hypothetical protein